MVATALFIAVAPALLLSPRAPCPRVPSVAMQSPDAPPKLDFMKLLDGESTEDKPKASGGAKVTIKKREPKPKPKVEEESAAPAAATDDATTTVVTPPEPTAAAEEKEEADDALTTDEAAEPAAAVEEEKEAEKEEEKEEEDDGVKVKISAPAPGASSVTVKKPSDTPKPPLFDAGELLQGHEALAQMVEGCEEACDPALLMTSLASTWDDIDGEKTSALRTWLNKLEGDFGKGEQDNCHQGAACGHVEAPSHGERRQAAHEWLIGCGKGPQVRPRRLALSDVQEARSDGDLWRGRPRCEALYGDDRGER